MLKLNIYLLIVLISVYLSQINKDISKIKLRSLNPKSSDQKKDWQKSKLFQTLYTDSPSNNYYYTTLYITDKKIKQTYLIDTGLEAMTSVCSPCDDCGKQKTNYYELSGKKLNNELKCGSKVCKLVPANGCLSKEKNIDKKTCSFYSQKQNGDGIKGYYLSNIVYFEEDKKGIPALKKVYRSYALPLGCTLGENGRYKDINTDGVMGLNNNKGSFIDLLYNLKIIDKNIFTLCFGLEGGYMSIGEIDTTYHMSKQINYVPLENSTNYYISINSIQIGKNNIEKKNINAIIDSGNTLTYLPKKLYDNFIKQFDQICTNKKKQNICGKFKKDEKYSYCASFENKKSMLNALNSNWPIITLELSNNFKYIWKPINYYYVKSDMKTACIGFMKYNLKYISLGANFMHGYDMIFDKEKSLLGIVPSDCSKRNIIWNQIKGMNPVASLATTPAVQKKKILEDNVSNDEVEFIKGKNKELERIIGFKFINFIILLICILFLVIILLVVIIILMSKNNHGYPKLKNIFSEESKELNGTPTLAIEETNEEPNEEKKEEKNNEDKKEEKVDNENNDIVHLNEANDTRVTNEEVEFLKNMMKKSN